MEVGGREGKYAKPGSDPWAELTTSCCADHQRGHVLVLGLPGSRQAIDLLIVVFVRGLRKTIAPGSRAARGAVALGGMRGKQHFQCAQI